MRNMRFISVKEKYSLQSEHLYESSFPPEERRDWNKMKQIPLEKGFCFYAVEQDGDFVGIISLWEFDEFVYAEHFAVREDMRNKGLGTDILQKVLRKYDKPVVLEIEPPVSSTAKRREEFYKRNGFFLYDDYYFQPPYDDNSSGTELKIMSSRHSLEFYKIKNTLYKHVYQVKNI